MSEDIIIQAAQWLATEKSPPSPVIPTLQRKFGLDLKQACAAAREAGLIRARAL
ncbi:hypothetical protein [Oryzicola mucosus]|uniref:Uncharacterized protein n=1 Tax=Oryzicola mucosus TaxID=2767425 RepID=A0A8J6PN78_9HYPH|nr:hypothetical protein [Oryzicola mucosus]MBD0416526.1 hypothetical protein [Oryzicola mucosus]